jgi:uncharacterized Fe-S center protein
MRCSFGDSLLLKLRRLLDKGGFDDIDFKKKFVAVKIHFGEPGNLSFLRPNFAKVVADKVTHAKGYPFLTDCGTLYVGRRTHALSHMDAAFENGFSPLSTGCQLIIADGLKGTDDVEVPIEGGKLLKSARIGRAIMDADIVISLNHFKGHEQTGFGGALKNVGMGSGSRGGKMVMHNDTRPRVKEKLCVGCKICERQCAHDAIKIKAGKALIDESKCVGCGRCLASCAQHAIINSWSSAPDALSGKIVEYAKAVVQGRPSYHINVVNQVSPYCDCHNENDAPVVSDIGIFASSDIVAVDQASVDAVNKAAPLPNTVNDERTVVPGDIFGTIHPSINWETQLIHGEEVGLGTRDYELVTVK